MQESFSRLWDGFNTDKEAKAARDARAKELKTQGYLVYRFRLTNQLKKYSGFGQPDGRLCNCYYVEYR